MIEAARRHCAQITRRQAANFYYGMRLLPAPKRHALFAIYAFARRIDDIGDGTLPEQRKLELLAEATRALADDHSDDWCSLRCMTRSSALRCHASRSST